MEGEELPPESKCAQFPDVHTRMHTQTLTLTRMHTTHACAHTHTRSRQVEHDVRHGTLWTERGAAKTALTGPAGDKMLMRRLEAPPRTASHCFNSQLGSRPLAQKDTASRSLPKSHLPSPRPCRERWDSHPGPPAFRSAVEPLWAGSRLGPPEDGGRPAPNQPVPHAPAFLEALDPARSSQA